MEIQAGDKIYRIINNEVDKTTTYIINEIITNDSNWHDGYFIEINAFAINENTNIEENIPLYFSCQLQNYYENFFVKVELN